MEENRNFFEKYLNLKGTSKVVGVLVVLGLLYVAMLTIRTGSVGVKSTLGKYDMEELSPGLHFILPFVQSVQVVDTKVHIINYKGGKDLPDKKGIIEKPFIGVLDKRGLPVHIELTVQYKLISSEAAEMLAEWGVNWEEKQINPAVREQVRDVIGNYPAEQLPVKRTQIATEIEQGIRKSVQSKTNNKVEVVGVQLRDIDLPKKIKGKIEEVQLAKQEAERMKYVQERAMKDQEVKKVEAETLKIQKVVAAEAEAEKRIKEAEGRAKARILQAEATKKANYLISQSITPAVIKWRQLDVAQTQAEALKLNPNTTIFVGTPSEGTKLDMWLPQKKK